jgi:hypothetical protein
MSSELEHSGKKYLQYAFIDNSSGTLEIHTAAGEVHKTGLPERFRAKTVEDKIYTRFVPDTILTMLAPILSGSMQ